MAIIVATGLQGQGATAEVLTIPGPEGALSGAYLAAEDAQYLVVLVPGSGPIDRDGNGPQVGLHSDSYRLLAEALAASGVASIRIDKRGFFGSAAAIGDPNDVTIAAYAQDVRDWVTKAAEKATCVWLAGHSEGGLVSLIAAMQPQVELCGVILLATAGRPIGQLMREQIRANPANAPFIAELEAIIDDLETGKTRPMDGISSQLQPMFQPGLQRYMIDLFAYNPVDAAKVLTVPTLVVQGGADMQVGVRDAELLDQANLLSAMTLIADMTHMLKADIPGQPFATYTHPHLPLHPALLPAIMQFIAARTPVDN
ncbi:alpha/beta fold hydrolase [uncultured Roseobacter sp.]|uniref:alpha/beta hydrolase n=1 Tax=uncultured Roseobacter sp. TaxID=114847 RepID=UPI0026308659|nr:alpha/beta fold hydrolase [uncultured Roseobacter sp.]